MTAVNELLTEPETNAVSASEAASRVRQQTVLGVSLKLYLDVPDSIAWAGRVARIAADHPRVGDGSVSLFVLPSLPALPGVRQALADTPVAVGAQDLFGEDRGGFTGGISGADLAAIGATLVEINHMERRVHFGENAETARAKLAAAVRNGLTPVFCVGERRDDGVDAAVADCVGQLESAFDPLPPTGGSERPLIVAYEPEWAIGATDAAGPDHINGVCAGLQDALAARPWSTEPRVIYGGSAQPGLLSQLGASVDGLFLGRFAHDPDAIGQILDEVG